LWVGTGWLVFAPTDNRDIPQPAEGTCGLAAGIRIYGALAIRTSLRKVIQESPIDDVTQLTGDGNVPPRNKPEEWMSPVMIVLLAVRVSEPP
jgi:hypothetical protein